MPELPEVETTIKGLSILIGEKIVDVNIYTKKLRYTIPSLISKKIKEVRIIDIRRIAKYIIITLSNGYSLVIHLGMSGRLKLVNKSEKNEKHDHVVFNLKKSNKLAFNDPRKFGFIDMDLTNNIYKKKYINILGIDALDKKLNSKCLFKKINNSEAAIKQILLNQKIISGIGNIYANEILFHSKISPFTKGKNLTHHKLSILIKSIKLILRQAIKYGGSSIKNYKSSSGTLGNFQENFLVYNKEKQKVSGFVIKKIFQHGRSTYYCPEIQKN